MEEFHYLSKTDVEYQLTKLLRGWAPEASDQQGFLAWAWLVASASDTFAAQNRSACVELLRDEAAALERVIKGRTRHVGGTSHELQSKRAFLAYLEAQVETQAARAQSAGLS
jgi:hypothetical protein